MSTINGPFYHRLFLGSKNIKKVYNFVLPKMQSTYILNALYFAEAMMRVFALNIFYTQVCNIKTFPILPVDTFRKKKQAEIISLLSSSFG